MLKRIVLAIVFLGATVVVAADAFGQTEATMTQAGHRITMITAGNAFRDEEFDIPYRFFVANGAVVTVASSRTGEITGMLGMKAKADILVKDIDVDKLDALVIVGGAGAREYWKDQTVHKFVREVVAKNKVLAAICISPVTLAYAGVLKGKKATVWISERGRLVAERATYTGKDVERDGLIVTADGPNSAQKFAETVNELVLEQVRAKQKAQQPAESEKAKDVGKSPETQPKKP